MDVAPVDAKGDLLPRYFLGNAARDGSSAPVEDDLVLGWFYEPLDRHTVVSAAEDVDCCIPWRVRAQDWEYRALSASCWSSPHSR